MAKTGRKGKYTPEIVQRLVGLLEDGNTDTDTCALVGVNPDTFYTWIGQKSEFSDAVTRARGIARQRAVDAYRASMKSNNEKITADETFSETRLDKAGQPYTYIRKVVKRQLVEHGPDWRAAESYLKRRDPANWAETFVIKVTPEQAAILKKYDMTPSEAFQEMINEFARMQDAETSHPMDS